MPRSVLPNSRVVRQLFPDNDVTRQSNNDNLANIIQEAIAADHKVMQQKWNFDFRNEHPLDGVYEWTKSDGFSDWIGVKATTDVKISVNTEHDIDEKENEINEKCFIKVEKTPKGVIKDNIPLIRKRKTGLCHIAEPAARRKISFD